MLSRGRLLVAMATSKANKDSHKSAICAEVTIPDKEESTNTNISTYEYDSYQRTCDWINKNNFGDHTYHINVDQEINLNASNLTVGYEKFNCFDSDTEVISNSNTNCESEANNLEICQDGETSTSKQLSTSKIPDDYLITFTSTNVPSSNVNDQIYSNALCNADIEISQNYEPLTLNQPSTSKNPNGNSNALDIYEFKSDTIEDDKNDKDFNINCEPSTSNQPSSSKNCNQMYSNALDIYEYKSISVEDDENDKDFDINEYMSNISETESSASSISECQTEFHGINEERDPSQPVFEKSKNQRNKNMHCKFCSEDIATNNFLRHLIRKHKNEDEVKNILEFPKKSKKRRQALSLLRNDTNFNLFIQGIVRPKKQRFKNFVKDDEYIPCSYCKVLIVRHYLKRHAKSCTVLAAKEIPMRGKINHVSRSHTLTACATDPTNVISQLNVKEQVFDLMKGDNISLQAKKDLLIVNFGNSYLKKHKREGLRYACSNRMRELSRLLISSRKMMENENMALKDILHPKYFDNVISAVRNIAGYDAFKKSFKAPSLAMHLGTSLKLICNELIHLILKEIQGFTCHSVVERKQWLDDVKNFRKLVETRWNTELASLANKDLQEKRWKKPLLLPLISDIKKFREETLNIANTSKELFFNNNDNGSTYTNLVQCVLSLLIVFNRRRIGDVQFLKISEYQRDTIHTFTDFDSILTNTEKILTKKYKRVLTSGKGSRAVVVLIPTIIQDFIDILIKNRSKYIPSDNEYIFAIPGSTIEWGKGDVAIRSILKKIKLENAQAFSSNKLRKQIATIMQILNLNKNDIKQFSDFMGHTLKTHEEFYELPVDIYQTAKMSKILLFMEKGCAPGDFKGKSLSDINLDCNTEYAEENDSGDDIAGSVRILNNENDSTNVLHVSQNHSLIQPPQIVSTGNNNNVVTESINSLPLEESIQSQGVTVAVNVTGKRVNQKKSWTEQENELLRKHFEHYIKTETYPAGSEIRKFILETKISRNIPTIKAKIQHLINLSKKKNL